MFVHCHIMELPLPAPSLPRLYPRPIHDAATLASTVFRDGQCALPDGLSPTNCRGMALLGFKNGETVYFCVHQVSVELWRQYDTPRASIQKKIVDLNIQLLNCSREQIKMLRVAGIIENFRATTISLRDTERLFDALEMSRKKRGLQKHALKVKSDPLQRAQRIEEQRARRLSARAALGEGTRLSPPAPLIRAFASPAHQPIEGRALNGVGDACNGGTKGVLDAEVVLGGSEFFEVDRKLLVAEEASQCGENDCELYITVELNGKPSCSLQSGYPVRERPSNGSLSDADSHRQMISEVTSSLASPQSVVSTSLSSSTSITQSQLSSPVLDLSGVTPHDLPPRQIGSGSISPRSLLTTTGHSSLCLQLSTDEALSEGNNSSVFFSPSPTPTLHSPCSSSQLASSSSGSEESSVEQQSASTWRNTHCNKIPGSGELEGCRLVQCNVKTQSLAASLAKRARKPALIKLRHLALATSPSSIALRPLSTLPPSPLALTVSVPLSMLSPRSHAPPPPAVHKVRTRGVALSSFVTKKNACNRTSSSSSSDSSSDVTANAADSAFSKPRQIRLVLRGRNGQSVSKRRGKVHHLHTSRPQVIPGKTLPSLGPTRKARNNATPFKSKLSHQAVLRGKASDAHKTVDMATAEPSIAAKLPATSPPPSVSSQVPAIVAALAPTSTQVQEHAKLSTKERRTILNGHTGQRSVNAADAKSANTSLLHYPNRTLPSLHHSPSSPVPDDDQISVHSSSTVSTSACMASLHQASTSGQRQGGTRLGRREQFNGSDAASSSTGFCFEDLFGYYPPKLVLKAGELQPETSLSVKNIDRHSVPANHPVFHWNLGHPVKGPFPAGGSGRRRRKTTHNGT